MFSSHRGTKQKDAAALKAALYQQIGQWKVELDWLKKKLAISVEAKRAWLEPGHPPLSLRRQCALWELARSSLYYQPVPVRATELQRQMAMSRLAVIHQCPQARAAMRGCTHAHPQPGYVRVRAAPEALSVTQSATSVPRTFSATREFSS
jgi:hypothetical protein